MRRVAIVAVFAIAAGGCATVPTDSTGRALTIADAGPPPAAPVEVIQGLLRSRLKDPDSALIRLLAPPKAMVGYKSVLLNGGAGWRICAEVNAKNSYGGYVGYKRVFVLWNSGRVVDFLDGDMGEFACRGVEAEAS